jgi:hypothetical protein
MASLLGGIVDEWLLEHPAVASNPKWKKRAQKAHEEIVALYQDIAREHL